MRSRHPSPDRFEYIVHDSEIREPGAVGRAYQATSEKLATKAATAIILATIVGVATLHLGAFGSGLLLFRLRSRRETWHHAVFFVAGLQIALLAFAVILDRTGLPSPTEISFLEGVLSAPLRVWSKEPEFDPSYIPALTAGLLVVILAVPIGAARRYAARLSPPPTLHVSTLIQNKLISAPLLLVLINVLTLVCLYLAAYVCDQTQPRAEAHYPFSMRYLECKQQQVDGKSLVTGSVEIRSAASDPWGFDPTDFDLFLAATRTDKDPQRPQRKGSPVLRSDRIGYREHVLVSYSAISPNLGPAPFLLQAGQAALLRFNTELPAEALSFLEAHPDDRRCTLSYTQDYPIGAIGLLTSQ